MPSGTLLSEGVCFMCLKIANRSEIWYIVLIRMKQSGGVYDEHRYSKGHGQKKYPIGIHCICIMGRTAGILETPCGTERILCACLKNRMVCGVLSASDRYDEENSGTEKDTADEADPQDTDVCRYCHRCKLGDLYIRG